MGAIWSERNRIDGWLSVEKAVCEGWHRRGRIPDSAMPAIRAATCDLGRMRQIEQEVDHDVIAFLRATGESIGPDARFVHIGLTSSDVVDTALGKISGAVGTHAHVSPRLEEEVCRAVGLGVAPASTQIVQRVRNAFMLA